MVCFLIKTTTTTSSCTQKRKVQKQLGQQLNDKLTYRELGGSEKSRFI